MGRPSCGRLGQDVASKGTLEPDSSHGRIFALEGRVNVERDCECATSDQGVEDNWPKNCRSGGTKGRRYHDAWVATVAYAAVSLGHLDRVSGCVTGVCGVPCKQGERVLPYKLSDRPRTVIQSY